MNENYDTLFNTAEIVETKYIKDYDGIYEPLVRIRGYDKYLRGKSEILIIKDDKVLLSFKKDGSYSVAGGGWDRGENHMNTAIREAKEEVLSNTKDVKYVGNYVQYYDPHGWVKKKVQPEYWWYGGYIELYIGYYDSKYTGYIADHDKDSKARTSRWYTITDIIDKLIPEHRFALQNYLNESVLFTEETIGSKRAYPVFVVTSFTYTPFGQVITRFQNSKVSHASLSLDSSLNKMYTFSADLFTGNFPGGFAIESLEQYKAQHKDSYIKVIALFLKKKDYDDLRYIINDIANNIDKYKYHAMGIIEILFNIKGEVDDKMICSEFVARMLRLINVDLGIDTPSNLISPKDFYAMDEYNTKAYTVFDGFCRDYSKTKIDKKISSIKKKSEYIKEHGLSIQSLQYDIFNEGYVFNKNDIRLNLDKWKKGEENILYVAGLSGSGKSTLGEEYAKKYNAIVCELDKFQHNRYLYIRKKNNDLSEGDKIMLELFDSIYHDKVDFSSYSSDNFKKEIESFLLKLINKCSGQNKLFIFEGVQIFSFFDPNYFENKPIIIKGTSALVSFSRKYKRDKEDENIQPSDIIKLVKWYIKSEYDLNKFEKGLNEETLLIEAKEFPVDFEEDGSLIIKNYKKLDFEAEYSKSHKLLIIYAKTENLEGIKYELSKLWFMNVILEKRIYSNPPEDKLKEYTKVRARILNDFNKYLEFVLEREPNFNFTEYYNDSPFSDVSIKIPGSLISGLVQLLKQIL